MATDSEGDTERVSVRTYVPAYQREAWDEHAEELDMSRAEFVRTMVQAGRRGFGADADGAVDGDGDGGVDADAEDPGPSNRHSEDDDLETEVLALLAEGSQDWDDLLAAVTDDIESRLDETLQELQAADEIRYSGRDGGYVRQ